MQNQVDHIGRIFASWVIVYFWKFLEDYRRSQHFWSAYFQGKGYMLILSTMGWVAFWVIFAQTHLVTLIIN
jgi:hypothetical protein